MPRTRVVALCVASYVLVWVGAALDRLALPAATAWWATDPSR